MNYGLTQMEKGELARALDYFQRAQVYNPNYYILEVNLGVANGALRNDAEAERHFARANQLAPTEAVPHYYYAVWLRAKGRLGEAIQNLDVAMVNNPTYLDAPHLLMDIYAQEQDAVLLQRTASETLARFPGDPVATSWLGRAANLKPTAETYLNQSLTFYQQGRFEDSINSAREALKLRPGYSEAWNNIAAAYNAQSRWYEGISAENQLAKNNLAWAEQHKGKGRGL
jgi:tetratricopeptide (TPR) repeat protein